MTSKFDSSKIPHTHVMIDGKESIIRLDTMKDIDTGKKYTPDEIRELKSKINRK